MHLFTGRIRLLSQSNLRTGFEPQRSNVMRMLSTRSAFPVSMACAVWLVAVTSPATAQTPESGKWELELHAGGILPANPTGGSVTLPGPGQVFTTSGIYPPPAPPVL